MRLGDPEAQVDPAADRRAAAAAARGRGGRIASPDVGPPSAAERSSASCSRRAAIRSRPNPASRFTGIDDAEAHAGRVGLPRRHRAPRRSARHRRRPCADRRRPRRRLRRRDRARVRRASNRSRSTACSTGATSGKKALAADRVTVKYSVVTFGCRVNQADSLGFEEELLRRGRRSRRAAATPIWSIVNTCSVTASADQGARQTIRRIARDNPAARIVVTGCYATRRPGRSRRACRTSSQVVRTTTSRVCCRSRRLTARARSTPDSRDRHGRCGSAMATAVRRGDRAGRRRPDRVHAARADRLRRAVLVLHHPDDARPAAKRAGRGCAARSRARRGRRLQGDRADRRAPRILRPRPRRPPRR